MNIDLHDRAALIDAITVGDDRPVAFLVGSPLSWDAGGGVPGVDAILDIAKELVRAKLPNRVSDFETAIKVAAGVDAYQAAEQMDAWTPRQYDAGQWGERGRGASAG